MSIAERITGLRQQEMAQAELRIERLLALAVTKELDGKPDLAAAALRLAENAEARLNLLRRT